MLANLMGDEATAQLLTSPGIDPTLPIGAMSFPDWQFASDEESEESGSSLDELFADPYSYIFEHLVTVFEENATVVLCLPVRDRQQLLDAVQNELGADTRLREVPDQPGWLQHSDETRIGFVGRYMLIVVCTGDVKRFDRNYPDFDVLARSSLGKNGFVYSLYRRGLPPLVRDVLLPAFQLTFAARFQQQDEEDELLFRMRTMTSGTQLELLDLLVSHIDEFRIAGHVDNDTRRIIVETQLIGPKNGKLARYCNGFAPKANPFSNLITDDAVLGVTLSSPLPAKSWKPTADVLYRSAQSIDKPATSDVLRVMARTVETGQFDLYLFSPTWDEGLIAVRAAGNDRFPEQFQSMLTELLDPPVFELGKDSVDGIPIHRSPSTLPATPFPLLVPLVQSMFGLEPDLPALNEPLVETVAEIHRAIEMIEADGTKRIVIERDQIKKPPAEHAVWLAATPQAIWVGFGSIKTNGCPDWFKSQIAASLDTSKQSIASRRKEMFRMSLRALGASPAGGETPVIQQVAGTDPPNPQEQMAAEHAQARGDLLRDMPNAVHCSVRSTETGVALKLEFDEAYFHWFAAWIRDSAEEMETPNPPQARPDGKDDAE